MVDHQDERTGRGAAGQGDRVAKALARAGVASRRDVEKLIAERRVALNGRVLDTPAVKIEPGDVLTVDGNVVDEAEPTRLWRYHKPVGLMTSHKDPQGRPTVFAALPAGMPRVISVGRLDLNSEGLLLLTNDGALARTLELPSSGWVRRYRARARGRITQERLDALKKGITIEGVNYGAIEAKLDKAKEGPQGANLWITVALTEGKNREVRRVLDHLGLQVNRLIRLAYGPFSLGTLESGAVEEIGPRVIRELLADRIAPENLPRGDRPAPAPKAAPGRRPGAESPRRGPPPRSQAVEQPAPRRAYGASKAAAPAEATGRGKAFGAGKAAGPAAPVRGRTFGAAKSATEAPVKGRAFGAKKAAEPTGGRPAAKTGKQADALPEKKTYKPGWAKPKPKPRPVAKAERPARNRRPDKQS
jgi:23S rRNA pseudouridine2605 synthase